MGKTCCHLTVGHHRLFITYVIINVKVHIRIWILTSQQPTNMKIQGRFLTNAYFLMYRITTLYELTVVCTVIHKFSKFNYNAYLLYTRHVELLMRLSLTCLLRSSNKSFMAVTPSTNSTGIIAISFPNALIAGTQFNNTIQIKYKFATRWNCSKRFFGRNDKKVYLVVRIRLSG